MGKLSKGLSGAFVLLCAFAGSVLLTFVAVRERSIGRARQELARIGLEDASRRVAESVRNVETVRAMSGAVALSHARAFAAIVEADPSILKAEKRSRFEALAKDLYVEELHVTDEKGVLLRSLPASYEGRDMASSLQSAAFLPALTNAAFELVQEPQLKGLKTGDRSKDLQVFQYAGVARRGTPGIVQVGWRAERLSEAMKLVDVNAIAQTIHVGRDGRVRISPLASNRHVSSRSRIVTDAKGRSTRLFETVCEGYLVSVEIPESASFLSSRNFADVMIVTDLVLLLLLVVTLPVVRQTLLANARSLKALFGATASDSRRSFWKRWILNPLAFVGLAIFALLLAVFWFVSTLQATRAANETLRAAAGDIDQELRDCVDSLLFFQGDAICRHYGAPEKMTIDELALIMDRYGLDELNVVDGRGIVIRGALADVGYDMGSNPKSAEFNRLLDGKTKTFSQRFRAPIENPNGVKRKYAGVAFDPPAHGYLQLGLSETRLKTRLDYFIAGLADGWHIGDTGFFLIARTETGEVLSAGRDFGGAATLSALGFDVGAAEAKPDEAFEMAIDGIPCLCRSGVVNRYHRYVAAIPLDEIRGGTRRIVVSAGVVLLFVLLAVVAFMTHLSELNKSLKSFIARDREQREKDLAVAKTIQISSLPPVFPDLPDWSIYSQMDTAREVGGDFFDFFVVPDGRVFFLIADVSGKGIPAAMFMMKAKATIRACVGEGTSFAAAIASANDRLSDNNDANMFVTAWFGLFDPKTGTLDYVNAGHNLPLVRRADGSVEWVKGRRGLALAAMGGVAYPVVTMRLNRGDSLFLYTDGVTEAMNGTGELYGESRLEKALSTAGAHFIPDIRRDVDLFVAGAEQSDDITLLALDYKLVQP